MKLNNLVFVEIYAVGYCSGQEERHTGFIPKDIFESNKETVINHTSYFDGLDGKHSEVEGELEYTYVDSSNLKDTLISHHTSQGTWKVLEELVGELKDLEVEDKERISDLNKDIEKGLSITTKTFVTFNGEDI